MVVKFSVRVGGELVQADTIGEGGAPQPQTGEPVIWIVVVVGAVIGQDTVCGGKLLQGMLPDIARPVIVPALPVALI